MSTVLVGSYPLGAINVSLAAGAGLIGPVLAQMDLLLMGPFGIGSALADLAVQLAAALRAQVQLTIQVVDPVAALKAQLRAILALQASIGAALALSLPPFGLTVSANASVLAAFQARIGGLQLLIRASIALKLPLASFLAALQLSAGPFVLISIGFAADSTLSSSVGEYGALVGGGIGGILPGDRVYGVTILTKSPSAALALAATIKTV